MAPGDPEVGRPHPGRVRSGWREWVADGARCRRRALLCRRDGARLIVGTRPGPDVARRTEVDLQVLCDNGFPPLGAFRLLLAVGHYVTGFVIEEQGAERRHSVSIGPVPDEAEIRAATPMLFGALLTGLEATRTTGSPR